MLDLHCHILPGIDDGSGSWEESLEMARIAAAGGVKIIVATPHSSADLSPELVDNLTEEFNRRLTLAQIPLQVVPGMEAYLDYDLTDLLKANRIHLIRDKYLLVELPMHSLPVYTQEILFRVMVMGYQVILAHPERNLQVMNNPALVYDWVEQGMLVQVNSGSLLGYFGIQEQQACEALLRANLVHFMGSDAHSCQRRKPNMEKAFNELKRLVPNPEKVTGSNGALLLSGEFSPQQNFMLPEIARQAQAKKSARSVGNTVGKRPAWLTGTVLWKRLTRFKKAVVVIKQTWLK